DLAVRRKSGRARLAAVGGLRPSLRWPLRRASRSGRSDVQLRPDQDRDGARRWTVACARSRIAHTDAVGSRELAVVQQPLVRVASRTVCGAEVSVGTLRLSCVSGDFETAGT